MASLSHKTQIYNNKRFINKKRIYRSRQIMKTINEIKEQYPFFSNASQPSSPGEIFINRHLLTADIIMVGYRDELRG